MSKGEPPSTSVSASGLFLIGKNSHGNWVVRDPSGLHGGFFIDRVHALKYAMSENGNRSRAVIMVPGVLELELDLNAKPSISEPHSENHQTRRKRVA
jgi:hypothetical protein